MKNVTRIIVALLCALICFSSVPNTILFVSDKTSAKFILPSSLTTIESEAFSGIAAENIILPDHVTVIGERAFSDNINLKSISIPSTVKYIEEHAFDGCSNLIIQAEENSYAARWAREHDYAVTDESAVWMRIIQKLINSSLALFAVFWFICPDNLLSLKRRTTVCISMRPQDRSELYSINYRFP